MKTKRILRGILKTISLPKTINPKTRRLRSRHHRLKKKKSRRRKLLLTNRKPQPKKLPRRLQKRIQLTQRLEMLLLPQRAISLSFARTATRSLPSPLESRSSTRKKVSLHQNGVLLADRPRRNAAAKFRTLLAPSVASRRPFLSYRRVTDRFTAGSVSSPNATNLVSRLPRKRSTKVGRFFWNSF